MVQEEIERKKIASEEKRNLPEGEKKNQNSKQTPEGKDKIPEEKGKNEKKITEGPEIPAFPFGNSEEKNQALEGKEIPQRAKNPPLGDRKLPEGKQSKNKNSIQDLKEVIMDKENWDERFGKLEGTVRDGLDEVKKIAQGAQNGADKAFRVIEAIKGKNPAKSESNSNPPEAPPSPENLALKAAEILRKEQKQSEERQRADKTREEERKRQEELYNFCLNNPEAKECKSLPDLIRRQVQTELEKRRTPEKGEVTEIWRKIKEEKTSEAPEAKVPRKEWGEMSSEEREALLKELDRQGYPHTAFYERMRRCSTSGGSDACDIVGRVFKDYSMEDIFKKLPEAKSQELSKTICIGETCKPLREWLWEKEGIGFIKKTEKGIEPVDEKLKKELDKQTEEKIKAELEKRPRI